MDNSSADPVTLQRVCKNVHKLYFCCIEEYGSHFKHKLL